MSRLKDIPETFVLAIRGREGVFVSGFLILLVVFWGLQIFWVISLEGEVSPPGKAAESGVFTPTITGQDAPSARTDRDHELFAYQKLKRVDPFQGPQGEVDAVQAVDGEKGMHEDHQKTAESDNGEKGKEHDGRELRLEFAEIEVPTLTVDLSEELETLIMALNGENRGSHTRKKDPPEVDYTGLIRGPDQVYALFEYKDQVLILRPGEEFSGGRVVAADEQKLVIADGKERFTFKIGRESP